MGLSSDYGFSNGGSSGGGSGGGDPLSLGGGLSDIIGGLLGMATASQQAGAYSRQGQFASDQDLLNARLATLQATTALEKGDFEANSLSARGNAMEGQERAKSATSDVDVNSGSGVDVRSDLARQSVSGQATIRANAFREAMGYQTEATEFKQKAAFDTASAQTESGNTILTGGLQFAKSLAQGAFQATL